MTEFRRRISVGRRIPPAGPGQRIGLFGGTFDPPHPGHRHVCLTALRRLELDAVWWLVTPGNPFKDWRKRPTTAERLESLSRFVRHPKFRVTGFEAERGLGYTAQTLAFLRSRRPNLKFVWIMGADNLASFHHWYRWQDVFNTVPVAIIDRPGAGFSRISSKVTDRFAAFRVDARDAALLPGLDPPAWTFLHVPLMDISSTELRRQAQAKQRL